MSRRDVKDEDYYKEAVRIAALAQQDGIPLRIIGSLAARIHCSKYRYLLDKFKRRITDIDYVAYGKYNSKIYELFEKEGYQVDRGVFMSVGRDRHIWYDKENRWAIDVFFDKLSMNHTIDFRNRLEIDYPTITLTDLILEKMQIVKINEKDIKDTCVVLREHDIGDTDEETINGKYIAQILSKDWGFYYTFTTNVGEVKKYLTNSILTEEDRKDISFKADKLLETVEEEPKSGKWKRRAKKGTSKKWYQDVTDSRRIY